MNFKRATLSSIMLATLLTGCIGDTSEEKMSQIIEKVLLEKPEIIINSLTEYRKREEAKQLEKQKETLASAQQKLTQDKHSLVLGNPEGDVTVVAFKDYRCGYCKKSWETLQELIASDKNVRIVYKEFPVLGAESEMASRFGLASSLQGVDKYRDLNLAFITHRGGFDVETLKALAKSKGIDADKMQKDAGEKYVSDSIADNMKLGTQLGIQGTPAFVIGKTVIPGAVSLDYLQKAIKSERDALKTAPADVKTEPQDTKPTEAKTPNNG